MTAIAMKAMLATAITIPRIQRNVITFDRCGKVADYYAAWRPAEEPREPNQRTTKKRPERAMTEPRSPHHHIDRAMTLAGIELAELRLAAGATAARVPAGWLELIFVAEGSLVGTDGGVRQRYEAGRAFAHWLDDSIALTSPSGARYLSAEVPIGWRGLRREDLPCIVRGQPARLDSAATAALRTLFATMQPRAADSIGSRVALEGHALAAVGAVLSACERERPDLAPPWLDRVEGLISNVGTPVTASALARVAGVHRTQLQRALRNATGYSVRELRRHAQIDRACELIREGTGSLAEVAIACGFGDQAHFSRAFKHVTGLSPARYRAFAGAESTERDAGHAAVDPRGTFEFSSTSAGGIPYQGTFVIRGSPNRYVGRFHTPVMPDGDIESVAVCGRTMLLNMTVPSGAAVIRMRFRGSTFTGDWRVGGYGAPLSGRRVSFMAG